MKTERVAEMCTEEMKRYKQFHVKIKELQADRDSAIEACDFIKAREIQQEICCIQKDMTELSEGTSSDLECITQ